ncbi:MAG: AAA family ATPase [Victivallaceae bacterium]|nr:AAA family ATPase [Victivallaceae bacterium]
MEGEKQKIPGGFAASIQRAEGLAAHLAKQIIGQEAILPSLTNALKYGWCHLSTPGRPRGTLFLLGPTGVGKTESIRAAVEYMYGNAGRNFLRLDMSEFSRQAGEEALTNLIGTPGGKSIGRLGNFLENNTEGIILYDEIEKSHPAIFTIMLQQLDAARITLSNNRTYDLSNFFLVATSNIGAQVFQNIKHLSERRLRQTLEMQLKERFSPEFVARFGKFGHEILIFRPLKPEHLRQIARKFYSQLLPQYKKSHGIDIFAFTTEVVEETLRSIDNTRNGARELRSNIERKIREVIYSILKEFSAPVRGWLDVNSQNPSQLQIKTSLAGKELILCQS